MAGAGTYWQKATAGPARARPRHRPVDDGQQQARVARVEYASKVMEKPRSTHPDGSWS